MIPTEPKFEDALLHMMEDGSSEPGDTVLLDAYQEEALRTWGAADDPFSSVLAAALGIGGESGEILDLVKKQYFHRKPTNLEDVRDELGDLLYYLAILAYEYGFTLRDVAQANVDKLRKRHPHGFDPSYHQRSAPAA